MAGNAACGHMCVLGLRSLLFVLFNLSLAIFFSTESHSSPGVTSLSFFIHSNHHHGLSSNVSFTVRQRLPSPSHIIRPRLTDRPAAGIWRLVASSAILACLVGFSPTGHHVHRWIRRPNKVVHGSPTHHPAELVLDSHDPAVSIYYAP